MRFSIDHKSLIPLHAQVEKMLREMIEAPEYQNNALLPNEMLLAKQLGISRNTVRQALNKLVYEGLLIRKKGVGTRVAEKSVNTKAQNWLSFSQEMKASGIEIKNFDLQVSWEKADEKIAAFFNIPIGKEIMKLERLRGRPEYPFVYFVSYFHPRIGLTATEDYTRPLYEILEKDHSVIVKLSQEEISAHLAGEKIGKLLGISATSPILKRKRFVYDPGGRPVEFNLGYYRADSFSYTIESEREL
ncbi:MAG: GntR family transcriptional regulator [Bacteroidetes bacterium CG18_big_fil_WC_8_21_14_2_50_41_14]|nr:MAG: GntR family transcriptional regulator [Bacteroidetes bacterium CG18_big_fil_WC_8_21_14_2_50_41_14]PIY31774.1 MAG: GntR family transcriptional regulator [Bacteroidetes bacterium CG_4_10_14_3_um_filter_42_6]PJB54819.1 MAG: GntR family transcriptional regulator [Bacteroidetes bacterium CG_4_9_14_3_um_filter_41_19]